MVVRFYSSVAPETTLSAGITNSATSITVGSVTGFPSTTPYTLALDYEGAIEELVQVEAAAGTTLTVTRAIDGTSAAAHNAGARVRHVSSARDFADSRSHENTGNGVHGLAPGEVIVGTTSSQTLTNKTLTSPVVNSATLNGILAGSPTFTGTWTGDVAAKFRLNNTNDVGLASTNHAFQIGLDSGANIRMDNNEIMAANNGAASNLVVQADGGQVTVNSGMAADNATQALFVNGLINSNVMQLDRTSIASSALLVKADADTQQRLTIKADGSLSWGSGSAAPDTVLVRSATGQLTLTNDFRAIGNVTANTLNTVTSSSLSGATTINGTLANSSGISYRPTQTGTASVTFTNQNAFTLAVSFPVAFPSPPVVTTNILTGSGEAARWGSRASSTSTTGFTLLVFAPLGGPNQDWSAVPVQWMAS